LYLYLLRISSFSAFFKPIGPTGFAPSPVILIYAKFFFDVVLIFSIDEGTCDDTILGAYYD
jgi:hypothetical protein